MLTLPANGQEPHTGVVRAAIPYGDANTQVTDGRLLAYDATQFGTYANGSKHPRVIWDSQAEGIPFIDNKFSPPVIANGRVLVPNYDGHRRVLTRLADAMAAQPP